MSKSPKKAAKDIAFEKEIVKFRHIIREKDRIIDKQDSEIKKLKEKIEEKDAEIRALDDWVGRLLEYTELSKEDIQNIAQNAKAEADILSHVRYFSKLMNPFFRL